MENKENNLENTRLWNIFGATYLMYTFVIPLIFIAYVLNIGHENNLINFFMYIILGGSLYFYYNLHIKILNKAIKNGK